MTDVQSRRRAVLQCLDQPRRVVDIATAIGRPVSNACGQIAALVKSGAVVKLHRGVYVRADFADRYAAASEQKLAELIVDACSMERSLSQLADAMSRAPKRLRTTLNGMVRQGLLEKVGRDGYRKPQADLLTHLGDQ